MKIAKKNLDDEEKHITHILNYFSDNDVSIIDALGIICIVTDELHEQRKDNTHSVDEQD